MAGSASNPSVCIPCKLGAVLSDVAVWKLTELLFDRVCKLGMDDFEDMVCRLGTLRTVALLGSDGREAAVVSTMYRPLV